MCKRNYLLKACAWGMLLFFAGFGGVATASAADYVIHDVTIHATEWAIYKDVNGNGVYDAADEQAGPLACVQNMLQYLSAGTSYDYFQYITPNGADASGFPNSSDGSFIGGGNTTWLQPQRDQLQFWLAYSRLDHDLKDPWNTPGADAPHGYNLDMIMGRTDRIADLNDPSHPTWAYIVDGPNATKDYGMGAGVIDAGIDISAAYGPGYTIYKPTEGETANTVKIDLAMTGSSLTPWVVMSDDVDTANDSVSTPVPPSPGRPERPPLGGAGTVAGQELVGISTGDMTKTDGSGSYDAAFRGDWTYNKDTTDGGVLGNFTPESSALGSLIIRVDLNSLGTGDDAISKIIFYSFAQLDPDNPFYQAMTLYDLMDATSTLNGLTVGEGDTFFILSNCNCDSFNTPEPATMALLGIGGAVIGVGGAVSRRRRARRS
ncbi:MAG: hypothetical protein BIFFINMI_02650 [Phycisphaerae bacterium]|nr:hypothetical protein [Phycisphaerae bacterium]